MKNKAGITAVLVAALIAGVFPAMSVSAEAITVEGENYSSIGFNARIDRGKSDMSGGEVLVVDGAPQSGRSYEVAYEVDVPEEGNYNLEVISSPVAMSWTNSYAVSINSEETVNMTDGDMQSELNTPSYPGMFRKYKIGPFYFKRGINTVTFIIDLNTTREMDGHVVFYLDCFKLDSSGAGISMLKANGPCGVFEKGTSVVYDVSFGGGTKKDASYRFVVTDFWGSKVAENTIQCGKEQLKHFRLNLGKFDTGWYQLQIYNGATGELEKETSFSVVPVVAERYQGETPFAADFASLSTLPNETRLKEMQKTLKYAGINWVRERYTWADIQPNAKTYNYTDMDRRVEIFSDDGIKITMPYAGTPSWTNVNNLFDVYNFQKNAAAHFDGKIQAWETWNEQDSTFLEVGADVYAAYCKAAALGVKDSGADAKVSFGGLCIRLDDDFYADLMLKNDVSSFSDFYNLHAHSAYSGNRVEKLDVPYVQKNREWKAQYAKNQPFWMTEAGIAMNLGGNAAPTMDQLMSQARYAVVSTAQSLASGVSKHFYFVWPAYVETGHEWGIFNKNDESRPAYASEAVMTYVLGKGEYKGSLKDETIEGYVFDNGKNDVLVAWTDMAATMTLKSDHDVRVTDLMGQEKIVKSENGEVKVDVSYYPSYISFDGEMPVSEYYPAHYSFDEDKQLTFTDAQRIILQQNFENHNQKVNKKVGYELERGKTEKMSVTVYNFNNKPMTGSIRGELDGFDVQIADEEIRVEAMSSKMVSVTLVPTGKEANIGDMKNLKFVGTFDQQDTSPSVSVVRVNDAPVIETFNLFEGQNDANNWDITNIAAVGSVKATNQEDGSVAFDFSFTGSGWWFYPQMKIKDASILKDTDGIVFWSKAEKGSALAGNHNVFAYLTDGRQYSLGDMTSIYFTEGWTQIKIPWSSLKLYLSPLGPVDSDIRSFDPTLIDMMSIGANFSQPQSKYYIKDFGYYVEKDGTQGTDDAISFEGLKNGSCYQPQDLADVKVTLPKTDYNKITVMLTDEIIQPASVDGNVLHLNLANTHKGDYVLRVICEDKRGYKTAESIRIFVA